MWYLLGMDFCCIEGRFRVGYRIQESSSHAIKKVVLCFEQ